MPSETPARAFSVILQNGGIGLQAPNNISEISLQTTNGEISVGGEYLNQVSTDSTNGNIYISAFSFHAIRSTGVNRNIKITTNASSSRVISVSTTNGNTNYLAVPTSNLTIIANTVNGIVSAS